MVCSSRWMRQYPAKTNAGVQRKERRKLSGIISSSAAASMKPAPRATKYRRYRFSQLVRTRIKAPKTSASAATRPSTSESEKLDMVSYRLAAVADVHDIPILDPVLLTL